MVKSANSNVKIVKLMLRNSPFFYPKLIISAVAERQLIVKTDYIQELSFLSQQTPLLGPFLPSHPPGLRLPKISLNLATT